MSFDALAAFKRLQDQHDVLAGAYAEILAEVRRTNELLTGIRAALGLETDRKEAAKSFLYWHLDSDGVRRQRFDTAAYFDAYHSKNGSGTPFEPSESTED